MTRLLVAFFPAGEMCGFVKYFREKNCVEAYLPLLETLPLTNPTVCSTQKLPLKHLLFLF